MISTIVIPSGFGVSVLIPGAHLRRSFPVIVRPQPSVWDDHSSRGGKGFNNARMRDVNSISNVAVFTASQQMFGFSLFNPGIG